MKSRSIVNGSRNKELSMLKQHNTTMTQYNTKLLTMIMEKLFHIPTHGDFLPNNKHKQKNGIKTCYGTLDQSNFTDKDLQQVMVNISHSKRVIRLGNKNGTISREREWAMF